ncbi:cell wall hydrolase [Thiolapillus sp.]|uniref:cell wall hydrolase n=2 Tax=Thiolapillus sp. TaxID=2017437 RepID=UPI0025DA9ACC|nr:cell wall hydrolase [Thiolapillus sp.]
MKAIAFIGAIMGASFILGICSVPRHQDTVPPVKIIWGDEAEVGVGGENTSAPNPDTSRRWNVRDIECLAQNIYHEARGEPVAGQVAVAYVVLNRVARRIRGTDVCEVVWAPHQFSWTRHPTPIRDAQAWRQAWQIATLVLEQAVPNPVGPADHYHADRIRPYWAKQKQKVAKIGHHIFYF